MINPIIKWVIVVSCISCGLYHLLLALSKIWSRNSFKLRHIFTNIPFSDTSRPQLVIEGLLGIFLGILGYLYL
jgi:hypothetical protein